MKKLKKFVDPLENAAIYIRKMLLYVHSVFVFPTVTYLCGQYSDQYYVCNNVGLKPDCSSVSVHTVRTTGAAEMLSDKH